MLFLLCPHRMNYWDVNEKKEPMEVASRQWIDVVKEKNYQTSQHLDFVMTFENEEEFMRHLKSDNRWKFICWLKSGCNVLSKKPNNNFTIHDFQKMVGDGKEIEVFDVLLQESVTMKIETFVKMYEKKDRRKIFDLQGFVVSEDL